MPMYQERFMSIQTCIQCYGPIKKDSVFCPVCDSIQPVTFSNPFNTFDIPLHFEVDMQVLDRKYIALIRKLHPDQFANDSKDTRILATNHSSKINEYFEHLKNPKLRAMWLYVLLAGKNHLEDFPSSTKMPQEFLMESMALSIQIESASCESELEDIKAIAKEKEQKIYAEIAKNVLEKDEKQLLFNIQFLNFLEKVLLQLSNKGI